MSVQASYQPMSILTERKGRAGLNVPSRTQKEKRLNEEIWKKERMMNMNESTAGIFRRQRQLIVAVLTATLLATPLFTACDTGGEPQESPQGGGLPAEFPDHRRRTTDTCRTEHCQPHHDRGFRLPDGR